MASPLSRIRGSIHAYAMSTATLKTMMQRVEKTTTPWIIGRSKVLEGLHGEAAEAGEAEDRLREDGAAERDPDVHSQHRHDREQGIPQHVVPHHLLLGRALRRAVRT